MEGIDLIKLLEKESHKPKDQASKQKIVYRSYVIETQEGNVAVLIPLRECENFEREVDEMTTISKYDTKKILRKFRGIRDQGE